MEDRGDTSRNWNRLPCGQLLLLLEGCRATSARETTSYEAEDEGPRTTPALDLFASSGISFLTSKTALSVYPFSLLEDQASVLNVIKAISLIEGF